MSDARELRTVTADGRVILPYSFQLALGVENGGQVYFVLKDGVVTLQAAQVRMREPSVDRLALSAGWADIRAELNELLDAAARTRVAEPEKITD